MSDWYTPEELGLKIKVTPRTVRDMARRGDLPGAKKIGKQWRFDSARIQAWLSETHEPRPVAPRAPSGLSETSLRKLDAIAKLARR